MLQDDRSGSSAPLGEIAGPVAKRAPTREVRCRVFDSRRWDGYQPRADDVVIATYSKCGTTWMQRIVGMLVFRSANPQSIWELSPWPDMRLFGPIEETLQHAEGQTHRRFFKSHLPYDALPVHEGVKFIHVARDGRDAALSLHNHLANFTPETWRGLDDISLADPKFGGPYPRPATDPAEFFREWVADDISDGQGDAGASYFHLENSYWDARHEPNMLLVHYADLKRDREGEMRRVAEFLNIYIDEDLWPELVEAAGFDAMKRQGNDLIPMAAMLWGADGADRFFNKGKSGRWQTAFTTEDLENYDAKVRQRFSPSLARWLESGSGLTHST